MIKSVMDENRPAPRPGSFLRFKGVEGTFLVIESSKPTSREIKMVLLNDEGVLHRFDHVHWSSGRTEPSDPYPNPRGWNLSWETVER